MAIRLADRSETTEEWTCVCGRRNVRGLSLCPECGRLPARRARVKAADRDRDPAPPVRVRGVRLAVGVIVLNIVVQGVTIAMARAGNLEPDAAIVLSLLVGLAFYGVVLALLMGPLLALRPRWQTDAPSVGLYGAEVGVALAGGLAALAWVATGHPVLDEGVRAVVSEASVGRILFAVVTFVVVAPVVEELLFRGVVLESLRRRGRRTAIWVSAVLFAVAHLRGLLYYTGAGLILGRLYWRRGLKESIAAHAAFNGSLVALAVIVVLGPTHLVSGAGVTAKAPSDWQVETSTQVAPDVSFALRGPGGSELVVRNRPIPPGTPDAGRLAAAVNAGQVTPPPDIATTGPAHVAAYPVGQAVEIPVTFKGHAGEVVFVPRPSQLWEIDVATGGSSRATHEYPNILRSLTLPA